MTTDQYLFCCLFRTVSQNYDELDYEVQYEVGMKLYPEFEKSKFNNADRPNYESMIEYLIDFMSRVCEVSSTNVTAADFSSPSLN